MSKDKYIDQVHEIVLERVKGLEVSVFLFGSRARGEERRSADLDIGFIPRGDLKARVLRDIANDLEESRVPYHVDLVDFSKVDSRFKEIAMQEVIWWKKID